MIFYNYNAINHLSSLGLANKTVGLVGLGRIGLGVAQRLRPFNIDRLLYTDVMGPLDQAKEVRSVAVLGWV